MRSIRNALVLGGAGFLGRWIVAGLVEDGVRVVSLDRDPRERLRGLDVTSAQGELSTGDRVVKDLLAEHRFDLVVHTVGTGSVPRSIEHPSGDLASNTATTVAVLEALVEQIPRPLLVHVSSAAVYGDSVRLPIRESHPLAPVSPYGVSKLAAEHYVELYTRLYELPAFSVRPFSLYGPFQRKLVVYDLMRRIEAGEEPLIVRSRPEVTRDLVFVEDAARAVITLARCAPACGEVYNVASGRATSLAELALELLSATKRDIKVEFTGELRRGDPLRWEGDPSRAMMLGVRYDVSLHQGLCRTVEWFRHAGGE